MNFLGVGPSSVYNRDFLLHLLAKQDKIKTHFLAQLNSFDMKCLEHNSFNLFVQSQSFSWTEGLGLCSNNRARQCGSSCFFLLLVFLVQTSLSLPTALSLYFKWLGSFVGFKFMPIQQVSLRFAFTFLYFNRWYLSLSSQGNDRVVCVQSILEQFAIAFHSCVFLIFQGIHSIQGIEVQK